jgi:hypothetical protein
MSFKSVFERNHICILDKRHRRENWESSNGLFDYAWESLYTDGKWSTHRLYDFGFSRRFVLVRVWYLSSSEVYTNNLRQFICPLSLFLKEIPFASLTNAIDVKIERVLTGFLIGWTICFSQSRMGKSVHRWEVVNPTFVRLRIFTAFCFGSCMIPQQFGGLH